MKSKLKTLVPVPLLKQYASSEGNAQKENFDAHAMPVSIIGSKFFGEISNDFS